MNKIMCPVCGSPNIRKQTSFARKLNEGESPQKPHIIPNICLEEDCEHEWFNKK